MAEFHSAADACSISTTSTSSVGVITTTATILRLAAEHVYHSDDVGQPPNHLLWTLIPTGAVVEIHTKKPRILLIAAFMEYLLLISTAGVLEMKPVRRDISISSSLSSCYYIETKKVFNFCCELFPPISKMGLYLQG